MSAPDVVLLLRGIPVEFEGSALGTVLDQAEPSRRLKKVSDHLGIYTFRAQARNIVTWGDGDGSAFGSDQRQAPLLPREVEMLPENDLIGFRRGMDAAYGRKVRYHAKRSWWPA